MKAIYTYTIETENGKFKTIATNGFSAGLKAFWLGWRSYFDLNPQCVIITKYKWVKDD